MSHRDNSLNLEYHTSLARHQRISANLACRYVRSLVLWSESLHMRVLFDMVYQIDPRAVSSPASNHKESSRISLQRLTAHHREVVTNVTFSSIRQAASTGPTAQMFVEILESSAETFSIVVTRELRSES
jgi:type II secretory pathway component PulM